MSIPRYKVNPLWIGMPIADDKEGKLCEYRDYVKLEAENARLKAEVEAQAKRWAESEDLISHYKQQMDEAINDCQCSRLKAEVERLTTQGGDSEPRFVLLSEYRHLKGLLAFATTKYCRLEAEVDRLRKAGDMMAVMVGHIEVTGDAHQMMLELSKEWNAAKEGKSV